RVHMPGRVKNPYPWLARASVFVLSSRWEGYPNVLLEAQYLKRPIVTTEYDRSVRQILAFSRKEQFRVIPVAHPVMMADSIRELLVQKSAVYDDVTLNDMTGSALDDYEAVLTAGTA
ncbi:MAG: glycosyltransferase, partial [Gammaproteobacteria bacterium]